MNTEPLVDYEALYHEATQEIENLNTALDQTARALKDMTNQKEALREELWENAAAVRQLLALADKYQ